MFSRPSTQEELQLNQRKHKHLLPQIHFATLKSDYQIRYVLYLVEQEFVLRSQNDSCHPVLADFAKDEFSNRKNEKGENIITKPLDPFSFKAGKRFIVNKESE